MKFLCQLQSLSSACSDTRIQGLVNCLTETLLDPRVKPEDDNKRKGFTLVELSIVLVIIGLLIGGILAAQSMISTAKINSVAMQIGQFDAGVENFKTKYNYLPGDAPAFGGDGDGIIESFSNRIVDRTGEIANFWYDLFPDNYAAAVIAPSYSPAYDARQLMIITGANKNSPESKFNNNTGFIASAAAGSNAEQGDPNSPNYYAIIKVSRNVWASGDYRFDSSGQQSISPVNLLALDKKIDDGIANAGNVISGNINASYGQWGGITTTAASNCSTTQSYKLNYSDEQCTPLIRIGASAGDLQ